MMFPGTEFLPDGRDFMDGNNVVNLTSAKRDFNVERMNLLSGKGPIGELHEILGEATPQREPT
jgi:hypothetical protein